MTASKSSSPCRRFADELKLQVVLQAVFLGFGALLLDGGRSMTILLAAVGAYWLAVGGIALRLRRRALVGLDRLFVRWGFLPLIGLAVLAAALIERLGG